MYTNKCETKTHTSDESQSSTKTINLETTKFMDDLKKIESSNLMPWQKLDAIKVLNTSYRTTSTTNPCHNIYYKREIHRNKLFRFNGNHVVSKQELNPAMIGEHLQPNQQQSFCPIDVWSFLNRWMDEQSTGIMTVFWKMVKIVIS
jgi:hypothetical protein